MELIIDNGYSRAEYDKDLKVIYATYKGLVDPNLGKESMIAQKEYGLKHGLVGAIADFTELKGTFTMLNEWAEKEFFPPLLANGLKCSAIVVNTDIFVQFATKDIIKKMGSFEIQIFDNKDTAWDWIKEKVK